MVVPDGFNWGAGAETIPPKDGGKFVRIRIMQNDGSELTPDALRDMVAARWPAFAGLDDSESVDELDPETLAPIRRPVRRRAISIPIDLFTVQQRQTLNNLGYLGYAEKGQAIITVQMARTRIQNKLNGETL
jgi:hypothetical protein